MKYSGHWNLLYRCLVYNHLIIFRLWVNTMDKVVLPACFGQGVSSGPVRRAYAYEIPRYNSVTAGLHIGTGCIANQIAIGDDQ